MGYPAKPRTREHRLATHLYEGQTVSFTACVERPAPSIAEPSPAELIHGTMLESCQDRNCKLHLLVIMPDHLHMILEPDEDDGNPLSAMRLAKQRLGYRFKNCEQSVRWQRSFYDHIVRNPDSLFRHSVYFLENPVRAGFVEVWRDWPYRYSESLRLETMDDLLVGPINRIVAAYRAR